MNIGLNTKVMTVLSLLYLLSATSTEGQARGNERGSRRDQGQRNQQASARGQNNQQNEGRRNNQQGQRNQQASERSRNAQQNEQRKNNQQEQRNQQASERARNAQQNEQRKNNQQEQRDQQASERARNAQQDKQRRNNQQGQRDQQASERARNAQQNERQRSAQGSQRVERLNNPIRTAEFNKAVRRPSQRPQLRVQNVPLQTAHSFPDFSRRASSEYRDLARIAEQNMRTHLIAVSRSQAPRNYANFRRSQLNGYYNNYPIFVGNQQYRINRQNTHYYSVNSRDYPNWYRPDRNWIFSNGFALGNAINIGLDWLGFGWQPYYGDRPTGFICARDYMPTPWMYESMTNQWRQPGLYTYVNGPGSDYTGPITVQVIEQVTGPNGVVTNVPYLYNAFYDQEMGRWGYENRQGYFIWLDD